MLGAHERADRHNWGGSSIGWIVSYGAKLSRGLIGSCKVSYGSLIIPLGSVAPSPPYAM